MKILHKTIVRKWFVMIESGIKKHEYLEIKEYWFVRLFEVVKPFDGYHKLSSMYNFCVGLKGNRLDAVNALIRGGYVKPKQFDVISANNGYQKDCPNIKWEHKGIRIGEGLEDWGAEPGKQYFILEIGELIK